ncbi:Na/Pi cotransporter family protein [Skermanella rosea]|uniref:Na/Pi cotransporter family protein n=1 Tax=Skermanella rosea TaxID=1817965 RepID=UPI0019327D10|nr:Na/Pi symporter [Skermanella rosea]
MGLLLAGFFALIYIFSKSDRTKNIALACIGFSLIFYGLNLMTGGLKPLRAMPEVMLAISSLRADDFIGLLTCVGTAALVTAMIHSSSATIGIVMGLGASGILDWQTAVAFSLGADLGTTITSWIASLNLSKNAKRAAYAHISFNIIGVLVTIPLFFLSMDVLRFAMQWFGGDPGIPMMVNGRETYPLVPVAIGLYSTFFNIFNTLLLFPFVGVFERVLCRIGHDASEDIEDYSLPKYLAANLRGDIVQGVPALRKEIERHLEAGTLYLDIARGMPDALKDPQAHHANLGNLSRDIGVFASSLLTPGQPYGQADLVASLIEEADFTESLGETLHQIAQRVKREEFSPSGREVVNGILDQVSDAMGIVLPGSARSATAVAADQRISGLAELRRKCLKLDELAPTERGSLLAILGSAERAFLLIERIDGERRSVDRDIVVEHQADVVPGLEPKPATA